MIAYYKLAESDPSLLTKTLTNNKEYDPQEQNIIPTESLKISENYTVDDLIRRMIIYSDNLAYELLLNNVDNNQIYKVYSDHLT